MFLNIAVPQCTTGLGTKKVAMADIATVRLSSLRILSRGSGCPVYGFFLWVFLIYLSIFK